MGRQKNAVCRAQLSCASWCRTDLMIAANSSHGWMRSNRLPWYIRGMFKFAGSLLALALVGLPLYAQGADSTVAGGRCSVPDTITVTGNSRVDNATVRATIGLVPKTTLNYRDVQRAVKALYATGNYDHGHVICTVDPKTNKASLDVQVKERPVLASMSIHGVDQVSAKDVKERLDLPIGTAVDPAKVAQAISRTDSLREQGLLSRASARRFVACKRPVDADVQRDR